MPLPKTFAQRVIAFNQTLHFTGTLPAEFMVLNPYLDNPETLVVMQQFYQKYYDDNQKRRFLIGINPSRHGAGVTGVPFTDTKRLASACGISMSSAYTHEISSVFIYDLITAYGGPEEFYSAFYINSPFPLAILRRNQAGNWVNANYYDDVRLFNSVKSFMIESIEKHIDMGLDTSEVFILGKRNAEFIEKLNRKAKFFNRLTVLEHPRYIQQYRSKERDYYLEKYLLALKNPPL